MPGGQREGASLLSSSDGEDTERPADPRFEARGPEAIVAALVDLSSPSHGTAEPRISAFGEGYYNANLSRCLALTV